MGADKPKPIEAHVFYELGKESWVAKQLVGQAVPPWLRRPGFSVYASGDCGLPRIEVWGGKLRQPVVGGVDVIKPDADDALRGYPWNMYHYVVVSGATLQAYGPFKVPGQHWLREIPEHLRSARTFGVEGYPFADVQAIIDSNSSSCLLISLIGGAEVSGDLR